jgi:hypothetical protein
MPRPTSSLITYSVLLVVQFFTITTNSQDCVVTSLGGLFVERGYCIADDRDCWDLGGTVGTPDAPNPCREVPFPFSMIQTNFISG